jgi:hypothetical protein
VLLKVCKARVAGAAHVILTCVKLDLMDSRLELMPSSRFTSQSGHQYGPHNVPAGSPQSMQARPDNSTHT